LGTGTARVNGAGLYYETSGEGQPLVLLHDGLLDCRIWDEQFGVLSERYRTIRYDRRGYGRSEPSSDVFSQVEDLRALSDALGVGQAHLVGASSGGGIAVDFALKYAESVRSLVLIGPSLSGYRESEEKRRRVAEIFSAARREGISGWREMWLDLPSWAPDVKHTAARQKVEALLVAAFHNFFENPRNRARQGPPAIGRLSEIRVPTLVVVGERDDPDNQAIADLLGSGISGARKVVMFEAAHLPNLENPEEFNRLVLGFLKGCG